MNECTTNPQLIEQAEFSLDAALPLADQWRAEGEV